MVRSDALGVEAYRLTGRERPFPRHFHDYYVIGYMEAGERTLSCGDREYRVGGGALLLFQPPMRPDSLRRLADAVGKSCGGLAAVFSGEGEKWSYALVRADGADIALLVKELNQTLHGRGGGRNGFAQGSVSAERSEIESFFTEQGGTGWTMC